MELNKPLKLAFAILILYCFIEIIDSVAIVLIYLQVIPNLYDSIELIFPAVQNIIYNFPQYMIPVYWTFTLLRIAALIGLWKNRMWGIYSGIIGSIITMFVSLAILPFGGWKGV
jgi:hypothetical protein